MSVQTRFERVYVSVTSDFDHTGYMQPRSILWKDGRTFRIQAVKDFRPASALGIGRSGDCYTVIVKGQEKLLYFERVDPIFRGRIGRWFVEKSVQTSE